MKKLLFLLLPLIGASMHGQIVDIPDANLKELLVANTRINTNGNEEIEITEASSFRGSMDLSFFDISSTQGLEFFPNLTGLNISGNNISEIDLTNNTMLRMLFIDSNELATLNVSNNTLLTNLDCSSNRLSEINVSNNVNLERLVLSGNNLTELDVTNNVSLNSLFVSNNKLVDLDLSNNRDMNILFAKDSEISNLNVSGISNLSTVFLDNNNISTLDLSANNNLTELELQENQLTSLTLSESTSLFSINLNDNLLTSIDLSGNTGLMSISIANNLLENLDLSNNANISRLLNLENNNLTAVNLSNGNNDNLPGPNFSGILTVSFRNNPDLTCVQIDSGFRAPRHWLRDDITEFNEDCFPEVLSITEAEVKDLKQDAFSIYTTKNSLVIASDLSFNKFQIYSVTGKQVATNQKLDNDKQIDISSLQSGLYVIQLEQNNGIIYVRKFVK